MKLIQPFKTVFIFTLSLLFASGALVYVLEGWFTRDSEIGPEPSPWQLTTLQIHSITGLMFLFLFGYLWATHVVPSFRRRRRLISGVCLTAICLALILTVPFLFYATHESVKSAAAAIHTYLGLASIAPFILHSTLWRKST